MRRFSPATSNGAFETPRQTLRHYLMAVATGVVLAMVFLALSSSVPVAAQAVSDKPPAKDPGGANPLGQPTNENTNTPMPPEEDQGPAEPGEDEGTIALDDGARALDDELIVNYKAGTAGASQAEVRAEADGQLETDFPEINAEVVTLSDAASSASELEAEKARIEAEPAVESVDYNYVVETDWAPNDPYFRQGYQANVRAVDALRAWNISRGAARVAVLDTGCYKGHYELNEGKVVAQTDKYYGDGKANDVHGHGTHVASILAADTNNGVGIAGGAPGASLLCAKVLGNEGQGSTSAIMAGMRWAEQNGARVINMSLGGASYQDSFAKLTRRLYGKGIFIVAAAGNDDRYRKAYYPAAYPGVMAVGGTERDGGGRYRTESGGSNWGPYVDIAAPGESIYGACIGGRNTYCSKSGTSMATPHVAAAGALLARKGARAPDIHRAIRTTADDRGSKGRDDKFGSGLVDYHGALLYYRASKR